MLDALNFVQGAVAKKDFVPALTHFRIKEERIVGSNGAMTLSSPINLDIEAMPKATQFVKAIKTCKETVAMHLTPTGKLAIKSGGFKAFIPCLEEDSYPETVPVGEEITLDGKLVPILKKMVRFIAEDASRDWARGIVFRGQSCFATNNICLVEGWLGYTFPHEINLPEAAVKELIRIGDEPTHLQIAEESVTFHYEDGRWLKTGLYSSAWPDLSGMLPTTPDDWPTLPDQFFEVVEQLLPFMDKETNKVLLLGDKVATSADDGVGASFDLPGLPENAAFHIKQLLLLKDIITKMDLTPHPKPCPFVGEGIRGIIMGMAV